MNWVQWSSLWNPDILIGYVIKDELHYRVHPYSFTTLALNISKYSGLGGMYNRFSHELYRTELYVLLHGSAYL